MRGEHDAEQNTRRCPDQSFFEHVPNVLFDTHHIF